MTDKIFDIAIDQEGKKYKGWVNPSEKVNDFGSPVSYHVVIDNVSFGHLSFNDCKWVVNEDRPQQLVEAIGKEIEKKYKL